MFNAWVRPKIQTKLPEKTLGWASSPWWWSFAGHPRHEVLWISQSQSGILFFIMNRPWSASSTKTLQYFKVCPECKTPALPMLFKQSRCCCIPIPQAGSRVSLNLPVLTNRSCCTVASVRWFSLRRNSNCAAPCMPPGRGWSSRSHSPAHPHSGNMSKAHKSKVQRIYSNIVTMASNSELPALKTSFWKAMSHLDAVRRDPKRLHLCLRVCPSSNSLLTQWNHATDQESGRGWEWGWCKWCHQWFLPARDAKIRNLNTLHLRL